MGRCIGRILIVFCVLFLFLPMVSADQEIVVVEGDTCWDISQEVVGEGWRYLELYQANVSVIETEAKARGLTSSDSCYWIFPGTSLQNAWNTPIAIATTVAVPIATSTPMSTLLSTQTPMLIPTPTNVVAPTIVPPTAEPTEMPVQEIAGSDVWSWLWLLLLAGVILPIAVILRRKNGKDETAAPEEKKEEKVFRPTRQEMLDATKLNGRFGSYNAERHKQLVVELDQKAALVAAALRSFGSVADEATRQKITEAPREQLREQQLLTAWVLQSMGLLNSDGTVTLYRGFRDEIIARNIAGSGRVSRVSSFTLNRSTAQSFDGGGVIVARVPIELIAGSYLTCSYPHRSECEVTIMSGQVNGARYYKSHEVPEVIKAPAAPVL